jgi:hypothetical protein
MIISLCKFHYQSKEYPSSWLDAFIQTLDISSDTANRSPTGVIGIFKTHSKPGMRRRSAALELSTERHCPGSFQSGIV